MSILSDKAILDAVARGDIEIDPFDPTHINPASYDLTLGDEALTHSWIPSTEHTGVCDVKKPEPELARRTIGEFGIALYPGEGFLMHTRERVRTERYVPVLDGKSSLGRLFVSVHQTAGYGDPGFDGQYTLEVTTVYPVRLYAGMRIAQMRFHTVEGELLRPYDGSYKFATATGPVPSQVWKQFKR